MNAYDIVYNLYDDYICILIFAIFELKVFSCTLVYFISDTVFISHVYMQISNWEYHFLIVIYSLNILSFFDWKFLEISNFICIQIDPDVVFTPLLIELQTVTFYHPATTPRFSVSCKEAAMNLNHSHSCERGGRGRGVSTLLFTFSRMLICPNSTPVIKSICNN